MRLAPDVVTMDLEIPGGAARGAGAGGVAAIVAIMSRAPTPILVLSGHVSQENSVVTMQALAAGAAGRGRQAAGLVGRAARRPASSAAHPAGAVAVIRRRPSQNALHPSPAGDPAILTPAAVPGDAPRARRFTARGRSSASSPPPGGPLALQQVITTLGAGAGPDRRRPAPAR